MMGEWVFVYGTLRRDDHSAMYRLMQRYTVYEGNAHMPGRLYEVAGYPGAIFGSDAGEKVIGELYRVCESSRLFAALDEYEECSQHFPLPHEYERKKIPVTRENGETLHAWVYLYARDTSALVRIASGDYTAWQKGDK